MWNVVGDVFRFVIMFLLYVALFAIMTYNFEQVIDPEDGDDYPMYPGCTKIW